MHSSAVGVVRFGSYTVDLRTGDLCRDGAPLKLQPQPAKVLAFLVSRRGELVTRQEIVKEVWDSDVFVDFEQGLNFAIRQIRSALDDDAETPRFIETVPKRGYRFIANVDETSPAEASEQPRPSTGAAALIGKKVSHYRVLDVLGGGGMGLVYRAEDLKLGRRVALKFLPEELANDPVALQRFEREARTASSLSHPNICTIYEVEEHEGQPFIVMELLDGQTLRERLSDIPTRPMELDEVLSIALQVCSGLEAAHEKGIIHRDIKPANIFLTEQNQVKILDFGLAKFVASGAEVVDVSLEGGTPERVRAASASTSQSSSVDQTLTRAGTAMGTAGYMSPEQIRGEKLDARTDIFSFGLVLYEMATGQRAFTGDTAASVHEAILSDSPASVRDVNSKTPDLLALAIDRSLKKDRQERYQSVAELSSTLQQVQGEIGPSPTSLRRIRRVAVVSVVLPLIAAFAVGIWWWRRPLAKIAFKNYQMTALTSIGNVAFADISPDGKYFAYFDTEVGRQSIWVQQLATSTKVRAMGPASLTLGVLRFSPDGNYLYYTQKDGDWAKSVLYRLAVLGGPPQKILGDVGAVAFSPDGQRIVFSRHTNQSAENYLLIANSDGSGEKSLVTLPAREEIDQLAWSPNGQMIAFGIDEASSGNADSIAVISTKGGKERWIARNLPLIGMAWLADQSGLVITAAPPGTENAALWIVSYPGGNLRRVTNDIGIYWGVRLTANSIRLVTVQKQLDSSLWVAPSDNPSLAGQLREGAGRTDGIRGVSWLPDGRLVYTTGELKSELWLADRDGNNRRQLTYTNNEATHPYAAPTGDTIVFNSTTAGDPYIKMIDSNGSNLRRITSDLRDKWNAEVSPDGKWITYLTIEGPWKMFLDAREPIKLDPNGSYPTISPDGNWIAFQTWDDKAKQSRIEILASDGASSPRFLPFPIEPQAPAGTGMSDVPIRWTADGKAITYVRTQNGASNLWAQPIDGGPAQQLTNFTSMYIWRHAWSRDGKYLVMARGNFSRDAVMLTDLR
jgi:serine/threonine protein kinase/WD40 repeat protein